MSIALEVCGLRKSFLAGAGACTARAEVLRGIDLSIHAGEALAIVGRHGAGKSVLLLCVAGLLTPDAGELRWFGDPSRATGVRRVLHHLACVDLAGIGRANEPVIHLVDATHAERDSNAMPAWIEQRRASGDAVMVALRDHEIAHRLAPRVLLLRAGTLMPIAHPRARVAEGGVRRSV